MVPEGSMPKKSWFAVKSLFRVEAFGEPVAVDDDYDADGTLVEERVVLLRARSLDDALARGKKEADAYADGEHLNPYGQTVRVRRLDGLEASYLFLFDGKKPEVWSSTSIIPASITDADVELLRFGPRESENALRLRRKYFDAELPLPVPPRRKKPGRA
jgi:hypothetical protein